MRSTSTSRSNIFHLFLIFSCASAVAFERNTQNNNSTELVSLSGINQLGRDYNITGFFVNNKYYGTVGNGVGGGGADCCIGIPKKWSSNMKISVRWTVSRWDENLQPNASGVYAAPEVIGTYTALVSVEEYRNPETLYVHFFHGGKVRVVSSDVGALSPRHPILLNDKNATLLATQGKKK